MPVIADWRDPESDPVIASVDGDGMSIDGQGRIAYLAPPVPGKGTLDYVVDEGEGAFSYPLLDRVRRIEHLEQQRLGAVAEAAVLRNEVAVLQDDHGGLQCPGYPGRLGNAGE